MIVATKVMPGDSVEFAEDDGQQLYGSVILVDDLHRRIRVEWNDDYPTSWVSLDSHSLLRVGSQQQ